MTPASRARRSARLRGIAYMIGAVFVFSIMDALLKGLSTRYGALQVASLRCISSLVCLSPVLLWRRSWNRLRVRRPAWHVLRALLGITMLTCFVYGVRRLTLSQTYSLYLTAPLMMTALSVPLFGERVRARRWLLILFGLSGVLVILQPWRGGSFALLPAAAIVLATLCYSLSALMVRSLGQSHSPLALVFSYLLLVGIGSGALAVREWLPIQPHDWGMLAGVGLAGTLGQLWITEAFSSAPPAVVAPFEYAALLCAFAIDWVVWSTSPSLTLLIGAAIVVGSGIVIIEEERRVAVDTPP
jgi:drug/metabolite transporter (DMT)-like permease